MALWRLRIRKQPYRSPALARSRILRVCQVDENLQSPETPDFSSLLVALEAVRRETLALAPNVDAALQLVAERARTFTRASGAAIALYQGRTDEMICRASAGDAPRSRLRTSSRFRLLRSMRADR